MNKLFGIILILLTLAFVRPADATEIIGASTGEDFVKVGAAGSQFLKIGIGGRANGMAGANTASVNDLSAVHWNPAGLASIRDMTAEFAYSSYYAGFTHSFAAIVLPVGSDYTFGINFVSLTSGRIKRTDQTTQDNTNSSYEVSDNAIGLSFSGYLTEAFSFGFNAKYITNTFASLSSSGVAFDIGTKYETNVRDITFGFSIHNLGTGMQLRGADLGATQRPLEGAFMRQMDVEYQSSSYNIPLIFRAGLSATLWEDDDHKVSGEIDFNTLSDSKEQYIFGVEYGYYNMLYLRAGYIANHDQMNIAGGIGINWESGSGFIVKMDYSITPTLDLGIINRLSLSVGLE